MAKQGVHLINQPSNPDLNAKSQVKHAQSKSTSFISTIFPLKNPSVKIHTVIEKSRSFNGFLVAIAKTAKNLLMV